MSEKCCDATEILFCSGNVGKYEHLVLNTNHINSVKIIQNSDINIVEPQMNTIQEIAMYKAEYAHKKLMKPVIVQDSGLIIKELKDFPGPYTKYVSQTIGCKGILRLLEGVKDRSCAFDGCLVFIDEKGKNHVFNEPHENKYWGKIAVPKDVEKILGESIVQKQEDSCNDSLQLHKAAASWSSGNPDENFWTIFVPTDILGLPAKIKTLAELSKCELTSYQKSRKSCFKEFAKWLEQNY